MMQFTVMLTVKSRRDGEGEEGGQGEEKVARRTGEKEQPMRTA